jgi:hypothetical protein
MSKIVSARSIGRLGTIFVTLFAIVIFGGFGVLFFSDAGHADDRAMLAGNHPAEAEKFSQLGEASPNLNLEMQVRFALRNKKDLETLLAQQQNPKSPNYHKWLTGDEFIRRFGPTPAQVKAVTDWLSGEGFTITRSSANGVEFNGPAAQAQRSFAVRIARFGDGTVYANTSDPIIPQRFAGIVSAIRGMDNMVHAVATAHRNPAPAPMQLALAQRDSSSEVLGDPDAVVGASAGFGPTDLRNFYDESVGPGADGTGNCIDIIDDSDFLDSTAALYDSQFGLPAINYTRIVEGSNPGLTGDQNEAELDVQMAHAAAPGASINFYLGSDLIGDITDAVNDNLCGAISLSYEFCGLSSSFMTQTMDPVFMRAASQGQSIFVSSGDQGSAGLTLAAGGNSCSMSTTAGVNEMSADPYVTSVGGTEFTPVYIGGIDQAYQTESVWNDGSGASGGGASLIFPKPGFQTGSGVPNDHARDVPDIALIASPRSPGVFWANDVSGSAAISCCIGGTSVGAPLWAGFVTVIGQMANNRLGTLNPIIYSLANTSYSSAGFHDITSGNNGYNGVPGFNAGPGYDQTTGWGTIDFNRFASAVKNYVAINFSPTPVRTATPNPTGSPTPASTITFVGAGPLADSSTAVTTVTISLPSGVQAGDTLLAQIVVYDGSAADVPTAPSGWTGIRHDAVGNVNQATSWLYYKVAGANEPVSYGWNISSNFAAGAMGDWRGASGIESSSGATAVGASPVSVSAPSLTPAKNGELQVYFYGSQSHAGPTLALSNPLAQRFNAISSKEGFSLAFGDLAAPFANNASPTYPATATVSGNAAITGEAVLLIAGSPAATPTPTGTLTPTSTRTATPTSVVTPTSTPPPTATATAVLPGPTPTTTATLIVTPTPTATATPTGTGIAFVGAGPLTDSSSAVTTVMVGLPGAVQSGDVLLAQIIVYDGTGSDVPSPPAGWSSIRHDSVNSANKATSWLYYKVAGSSEPPSYIWNISSNWAAGVMGAWRGASGSPLDNASGATAAGSSPVSVSAPSLTPSNNNEREVYFYGGQAFSGPTITLSNALTQRFDTSSAKEGFSLAFGDLSAPSAGSASTTYSATVSISGTLATTAQAVLLIPGSPGASPTPTGTMVITATPTPGSSGGPTPTISANATPTATTTPTASSITFVGASSLADSASAVTTVTIGLPSGVQSGDVLLAQIVVYDGTGSDVPTAPAGWISIRHDSMRNGNQATSWLYYKIAGPVEPLSYGWNIISNWAAGAIGAWRGVVSPPIDNSSGASATGGSPVSVSAPSLTPSNNNELQVYFYGSQSHAGPTIALSGALTQRFNSISSKEGFSLAFADLAAPSAQSASPTYVATANISGTAIITAQSVLLIP